MKSTNGTKVLFIITKSNWGGAQSYVYTLANRIRDKGYQVAVAYGGTGQQGAGAGRLATSLAEEHIVTHFIGSMVRDISFIAEWNTFQELYRLIKNEQPDVVHLNSSKAGIIGAFAARLAGVQRIVFTAHGWPHREPRLLPMRVLIWLASWFTVFLAHEVIVVSEQDYKTAPVWFSRKKLHVIHNGMDPFPLLPSSKARETLAALTTDLPVNGFWFLMNAELHPNKAIDVAIRAFSDLVPSTPDSVLVIIGEGQERTSLEALIQELGLVEHVFLLGFVPNAKTYLSAGDIFILPSRKEGFPLVLLEAGLAHLPIIAARTGGIPELIEDGQTGILIRPANQKDLAGAMARLHSDPSLATHLAQSLTDRIVKSFSETQMVEKTLDIY